MISIRAGTEPLAPYPLPGILRDWIWGFRGAGLSNLPKTAIPLSLIAEAGVDVVGVVSTIAVKWESFFLSNTSSTGNELCSGVCPSPPESNHAQPPVAMDQNTSIHFATFMQEPAYKGIAGPCNHNHIVPSICVSRPRRASHVVSKGTAARTCPTTGPEAHNRMTATAREASTTRA